MELAHTNMPPANYLHNDMLKFYEQLLRRLLSQPQSPAVVLIQVHGRLGEIKVAA